MKTRNTKPGFSAIELLITLFIAATFIISGSQLYSSIVKDGGETNMRSRALNKLAEYLQQYKNSFQEPCTPVRPLTDSPITVSGLSNVTVSIQISCMTTANNTSKITAIIKYGNPQKTIIDSTYSAPKCPVGFISVPGSSTYGTSNFCVMKYEAKLVGGIAVSQASNAPWINISQEDAITAAQSACNGCHLITEAEWMTIAQNVLSVASNWDNGAGVHTVGTGYVYSGHNDNIPANPLAADVNDANGYIGTGQNAPSNQKRTLTLTNGEVIWDLAGNVFEWTSGTVTTGQPGITGESGYFWKEWTAVTAPGTLSVPVTPASTGLPGSSSWNNTNSIGALYSYAGETTAHGFLRGGDWDDGVVAGVMYLYLYYLPFWTDLNVGFRVSR